MKVQGLLAAVAGLVVLVGLFVWSNQQEAAKEGQPDPNAPPKVTDIAADTITGVTIHTEAGQDVTLHHGDDSNWTITAPKEWAADQSAAGSLVNLAASLDSSRLLEDNATDLGAFGLTQPALTIDITQKDGKQVTLDVGDQTPTATGYYVQVSGDPRVFTISTTNRNNLDKTAWDLRDKRLMRFDLTKVKQLELTAKGNKTTLSRGADLQWSITGPRDLRADATAVDGVMNQLAGARMQSDPDAVGNPALLEQRFQRGTAVAVARVTDDSGEYEMTVRKAPEGDYLAESSDVPGVHTLTAAVGDGIDKSLDELRNHKLFDFGYAEPERIEFIDAGKATTFEKQDDKWMRNGTAVDSIAVSNLIDKLRALSADAFLQSGFKEPIAEFQVSWQDGQHTDHVLISKTSDTYLAKREGEPSVYVLESTDVDPLLDAARHIQDQAPDTKGS